MDALVIYESMFGNTERVARAICKGLSTSLQATAVEVGKAPTTLPPEIELIVVGGPTHAFGLSRPATRVSAAEQSDTPLVSAGIGVREWIAALAQLDHTVELASFDTHLEQPRMIAKLGSAANPIQRRLGKLGFATSTEPEHFWVTATSGPLKPGELERAQDWGRALASTDGRSRKTTVGAAV